MVPRIAFIDPVGPDGACPTIKEELDKIKHRETELEFVCLDKGPRHLEYRYYEALVIPNLLHTIKRLENRGYDGVVIGCFYDPGLFAAREIVTRLVVTAPGETSALVASTLGHKFSILVGREKWIPQIAENLAVYGMKDKLASFKTLDLGVLDFHACKATTLARLTEKAKEALEEDGADVIILGCTMQFGFYSELQEQLKVPVIDPVISSFKYAEFLVELRDRFGWMTSKRLGFEAPPIKEIRGWRLEEQYGVEDIWQD